MNAPLDRAQLARHPEVRQRLALERRRVEVGVVVEHVQPQVDERRGEVLDRGEALVEGSRGE